MNKRVSIELTLDEFNQLIKDNVRAALNESTPNETGKPVKLKEWAELHGIDYGTAWKWAKNGKIEAKRLGSLWYVFSNKKG